MEFGKIDLDQELAELGNKPSSPCDKETYDALIGKSITQLKSLSNLSHEDAAKTLDEISRNTLRATDYHLEFVWAEETKTRLASDKPLLDADIAYLKTMRAYETKQGASTKYTFEDAIRSCGVDPKAANVIAQLKSEDLI